jgi:hypothetical protein
MKKGISLLLIIIQVLFLNAQSLVVTGDTSFTANSNIQIAHHLDIKNISANAISVRCQKTNLTLPLGAESYFCFSGLCFSASATAPSPPAMLSPGQQISFTNSDADAHSGYYDAYGVSGIAEVRYCFYDENNPADQTCVTITYDCSSATDIIENENDFSMDEFFPNPAKEYTTINYKSGKNSHLKIIDILGNKVKDIHLSNVGTQDIYVGDLSKGMYFGNLVHNDKVVAVKKLIIK